MLRRPFTLACALAGVLSAPQTSAAQSGLARALATPTAAMLRGHLRFLSSDLLEGRAPGTRGGRLSEAYVASQFEILGLEPAGDSGTFFQHIPFTAATPHPSLVVGANRQTMAFTYLDDYVAWPEVPDSVVATDGDIVFVGYGISAPEWNWDDFGGVPLGGKILLVLVNDPGQHDSTIFRGSTLTYYGRWTYKIEQAARAGAAGVILIHTDKTASYPWSVVRNSWSGEQIALANRAPGSLQFAAWMTEAAARRMLNAAGRDLDVMMRRAQRRDFKPMATGLHAVMDIRSTIRRFSAANVIARVPGTDSAAGAVLFVAHQDHEGIGPAVNGDSIYNGAVDNASGVAALLATAAAFHAAATPLPRSVYFMATTGEEAGLLGAESYVTHPEVPLQETAAVINIDGANLRGRTRDIAGLGAEESSLGALFTAAAAAESLRVVPDPNPAAGSFFRSDQFPFARAGVPAVSIRAGTNFVNRPPGWGAEQADRYNRERYHQPSDEFSPDFDYTGALQEVRVMIRTGWAVAADTTFPTWHSSSAYAPAGRRLEMLRQRH